MSVIIKIESKDINIGTDFSSHEKLVDFINGDRIKDIFKSKPKTFPVLTNVTWYGKVIFGKDKQSLSVNRDGSLNISSSSHKSGFVNYSENFIWVECKRDELKTGDIAYETDNELTEDLELKYPNNVCAIIDHKNFWIIHNDRDILKMSAHYKNWFKLTKIE